MHKFLFSDMGAEILLVEIDEPHGIRCVLGRCANPLWQTYCDAWESQHPGSVPSTHGGTMMKLVDAVKF